MSSFDQSQLQGRFEMRFPPQAGEAWSQDAADSIVGQITWFSAEESGTTVRWQMRAAAARLDADGALLVTWEPIEASNQESKP